MKWLKNKAEGETVNYWQTISDVMSALLLIILLVMLLLVLYVTLVPQNDNVDKNLGDVYDTHTDDDDGDRYRDDNAWNGPYWVHDTTVASGGSPGGDDHREEPREQHEYDEPGEKAAVLVRILDGETGRIIRAQDIVFTVSSGGQQLALNTYYPVKVAYKEFATTEEGQFYLPEKLRHGDYTLRELSAPYGYEPSDNVDFYIDEEHDWDEPYIVDVMLFPARNTIRLKAEDAVSGAPVPGGDYAVYAAQDVYTADGTLRYEKDELVSRFTCDEAGLGQSALLYPGEYRVAQTAAPAYYADVKDAVAVRLGRPIEGQETTAVIACERTTYTLTVSDELYPAMTLAGAAFEVAGTGLSAGTVTSAADGRIVLDTLRRNATYQLKQTGTAAGYSFSGQSVSFTVDETGRIGGRAAAEASVSNRLLRVEITVRDVVLQSGMADCGVTLHNAAGDLVRTWTSGASAEHIEGLAPGEYRLTVTSGARAEQTITVADTAEIQRFTCGVWSDNSLLGMAAAGGLLLALIVAAILMIRKRRNKRRAG